MNNYNTPSVNPDPSVLIVSGETDSPLEGLSELFRKQCKAAYNLGLNAAVDAINTFPEASKERLIEIINSIKQPV